MKKASVSPGRLFIKEWAALFVGVIFLAVTIWWLFVSPFDSEVSVDRKHYWTATYLVISLFGGFYGLVIAKHWGGFKSVLGRSIFAFSVGLLLQSFGQVVYNFYTLVSHVEAPYPSLGDLGYFGSIPAYIYGTVLLGRAAGMKVSFKSYSNQVLAVLLPLVMLVISYIFFLKGYEFDWSSPLTIFLDFGYPLGQAIYVSIALLVLVATRKMLGGVMKGPLLFLLVALVVQYIGDFNFLYMAYHETWYAGGPGDYLFAIAYLLMSMALIYIGAAFKKIRES